MCFFEGGELILPNSSVLVIGAGIAGITVAQRLVENNIKVYLIEKESSKLIKYLFDLLNYKAKNFKKIFLSIVSENVPFKAKN